MSQRFLRDLPEIDLVFPSTPVLEDSVEFLRKETFDDAVNHCVRCAYFAVIIGKKHPRIRRINSRHGKCFAGLYPSRGRMVPDTRFVLEG
ncbi:hypothetical protein BDV36DRAFT_245436 [Aspergillus pseudocaelatus]|uniref:Uncharacterized protein n=1 Tax=Aspergillus pseudocaelatus TaxID=1825620 RepID=A0ABQ6WYQ6_9EURO|nr:hypothetical protein BDV36DRAFT_245436 [Aspergillus pseudocaelatus]